MRQDLFVPNVLTVNHEVFQSGCCQQVLFLACASAGDSSFQMISPPYLDSFLVLSRCVVLIQKNLCTHLESAVVCAVLSSLLLCPADCSRVGPSGLWLLLDSGNPLITPWVPRPGPWLWFFHKAGSWAVIGLTSPVCQFSGVTAFFDWGPLSWKLLLCVFWLLFDGVRRVDLPLVTLSLLEAEASQV